MSKTLPFDRAIEIIHDATCVRVDSNEVMYPDVDISNDQINLSMDGGDINVVIARKGNEMVELVNQGMEIRFMDVNGEMVDLMPLIPNKNIA